MTKPRKVRLAKRGLRVRAWWVMRRKRVFTLLDLMLTLCTGEEKCAERNLRKYCEGLVKVGILGVGKDRIDDGKPTSNGLLGYVLERDVGFFAPVVRYRSKTVFDPNSGQMLAFGKTIEAQSAQLANGLRSLAVPESIPTEGVL